MGRLFQIELSDGSIYVTREDDVDTFYKSKIYKLKSGCIVKNVQTGIQMLDLSKNNFFDLPIVIKSDCIVRVLTVKKRSKLEEYYLEVTSGIIILKEQKMQ